MAEMCVRCVVALSLDCCVTFPVANTGAGCVQKPEPSLPAKEPAAADAACSADDADDVIIVTDSPPADVHTSQRMHTATTPSKAAPAHSGGGGPAASTDTGNRSGKAQNRRLCANRTQYKIARLHTDTPKKRRRTSQSDLAVAEDPNVIPSDDELELVSDGPAPACKQPPRLDASAVAPKNGVTATVAVAAGRSQGSIPGAAPNEAFLMKRAGRKGGKWQRQASRNHLNSDMSVFLMDARAAGVSDDSGGAVT